MDSKFLYFALSSERSRNYLRGKATGTAGSMPKINQQTLISVPIDLPPLAEQREIVRRVEALFNLADQIEARYRKAQAQSISSLNPSSPKLSEANSFRPKPNSPAAKAATTNLRPRCWSELAKQEAISLRRPTNGKANRLQKQRLEAARRHE